MVKLPDDFIFSQGSLQDYTECARRFQLRYLQRLAWPAVQVEPALENERLGQMGARFHRMAQQWLSGLPAEKLEPAETEPELAQWWHSFQTHVGRLPGLESSLQARRKHAPVTRSYIKRSTGRLPAGGKI